MEARFNLSVGRLLCRNIREILEIEQFEGAKIRWREGRGIIEHTFYVIDEQDDVGKIASRITAYVQTSC